MRMRSFATLIGVVLLAGTASAAPVGLARSGQEYRIQRESIELPAEANVPFLVQEGDAIQSRGAMVTMEGKGGETLLMGEESRVLMAPENEVKLERGRLAMALPKASARKVSVSDIIIEPIGEAAGDLTRLAVGTNRNTVRIAAAGRPYAVRRLVDGRQIAVVGAKDTIELMRDALGMWQPLVPNMQLGNDPTTRDNDEDNRDEGLVAFFDRTVPSGTAAAGAAGAAAAAVGIGAIVIGSQGNDSSSSDGGSSGFQPGPSSPTNPVTPTPTSPVEQPIDDEDDDSGE